MYMYVCMYVCIHVCVFDVSDFQGCMYDVLNYVDIFIVISFFMMMW